LKLTWKLVFKYL